MRGRMDRPVALDHKARPADRVATGRPPLPRTGERLLRRLEAALNGLPARIADAGATPGKAGGRVVKTHSPLCRTKPSERGTPHHLSTVLRAGL